MQTRTMVYSKVVVSVEGGGVWGGIIYIWRWGET